MPRSAEYTRPKRHKPEYANYGVPWVDSHGNLVTVGYGKAEIIAYAGEFTVGPDGEYYFNMGVPWIDSQGNLVTVGDGKADIIAAAGTFAQDADGSYYLIDPNDPTDDSGGGEQMPDPNYGTTNPLALAYQAKQQYRRDYSMELTSGRVSRRRRRSQTRRKYRLRKPQWVDPYPWIPGTEPEKRLFEVLIQRHIYFIFQGQIPEFEEGWYVTLAVPGYEPDFILPQYRVIIDPFSPYHHSRPDAVARDTEKIALYEAMGYHYIYVWYLGGGVWAFDMAGISHERCTTTEMLDQIPYLAQQPLPITDPRDLACLRDGYRIGQNLGAGANSVAAANRARTRPVMRRLRVRR